MRMISPSQTAFCVRAAAMYSSSETIRMPITPIQLGC